MGAITELVWYAYQRYRNNLFYANTLFTKVVQDLYNNNQSCLTRMGQGYSFKWIGMEDIKEACHLLADGFIKLNPIYQKQESTYQEVYPVFYYQLEHSIKSRLTYALYLNGRMIGVTSHHDMHDYPKLKNEAWLEGHSKIISHERRYVLEIEKELLKTSYEPGEAVYCIYGSILPEEASKGVGFMLARGITNQLKKRGFKYLFGTASSQKLLKISLDIGATIVREMDCEGPQVMGEKYSLFVIDMTKTLPNYRSPKKIEIKPRL